MWTVKQNRFNSLFFVEDANGDTTGDGQRTAEAAQIIADEANRVGRRYIHTISDNDDDPDIAGMEFDAEAGRDVLAELEYIRSGAEKRNCGC